MSEFKLPSLGADMEAATLVEWRVAAGDAIHRGDIVAAVETDKGIIDIELFEEGIVDAILVQPGTRVPVGTVLATFHHPDEAAVPPASEPAAAEAPPEQVPSVGQTTAEPAKPVKPAAVAEPEAGRQHVSPAARRRARELGVVLEQLKGSGPHGAVTLEDVEKAATAAPAQPSAAPAAPSGMRRVIAAGMARSKREIPHYYLSTTIDMTNALTWLEQRNAQRPVTERMVYAALLIKAVATALEKVPELNGFWVDDGFRPAAAVNIGMAISLRQGGLVVPALRAVEHMDLDTVMTEFAGLVKRARSGHLRGSDLTDATITITSLGEQGVETVFPIIYPPQVAIVGFGAIVERAWSVQGMLASRRVLTATLAADHRVSDGHRGGLFLAALERLLQAPEKL